MSGRGASFAPLLASRLRERLSTRFIGHSLDVFAELASTQDRVRELAAGGAPGGAAIFAEAQSAGRGRHGRAWHSAPGLGLWGSVLLRPTWPGERDAALTAAAACAVADACESTGVPVGLRWPNDVFASGKKIAGVLVDLLGGGSSERVAIIGAGINVAHRHGDFPPEVRDLATSLDLERGTSVDREPVAAAWLEALERWIDVLGSDDPAPLSAEWRRRLAIVGKRVAWAVGGVRREGVVQSVDLFEGVTLAAEGRIVHVRAEHVDWLRPEATPER